MMTSLQYGGDTKITSIIFFILKGILFECMNNENLKDIRRFKNEGYS